MRGFILADLPSNLTLSNSGSRKALIDLKDLFELTRENPRQQANLRILSRHLNALLAYSNELMATRQQGVQKAVKMESSGIGFKALNETLSDLQRVEDEEHRLLVLRNAKADTDFHNTSRLLVWGSILAAVLIVVANILASYEVSRRQKIEDQLRLAMAHQAELVGTGPGGRARKKRIPFQHESRTPYPAQCHSRVRATDGIRRSSAQPFSIQKYYANFAEWMVFAQAYQRSPRSVGGRLRQTVYLERSPFRYPNFSALAKRCSNRKLANGIFK